MTVQENATPLPSSHDGGSVLVVEHLSVAIKQRVGDAIPVVTDVSFAVRRGETLGLVGESGCGKTVTSLGVMGVLPRVARLQAGSIRLDGRELAGLSEESLEAIRGREIAMIFQDAIRSLNPAFTVGDQIGEVARKHLGLSRKAAHERTIEMLDFVGIQRPRDRARAYPHQFSGGMAQRVMIAMALICEPKVLIADEPTTALDVTVQEQVLLLLKRLQARMGLGIVFITHDLGVVAEMCHEVAVMYAGQIVEQAPVEELFLTPRHPYTAGLLDAIPQVHQRMEAFGFIRGAVPSPRSWPSGCRFHPRCEYFQPGRCDVAAVDLVERGVGHPTRCVRAGEFELLGVDRHDAP